MLTLIPLQFKVSEDGDSDGITDGSDGITVGNSDGSDGITVGNSDGKIVGDSDGVIVSKHPSIGAGIMPPNAILFGDWRITPLFQQTNVNEVK